MSGCRSCSRTYRRIAASEAFCERNNRLQSSYIVTTTSVDVHATT